MVCASCGRSGPWTRFCIGCGRRLPQALQPMRAARRRTVAPVQEQDLTQPVLRLSRRSRPAVPVAGR